ncbi:MAG: hypothetical protein ACT4TC_05405 [Myxococcaceae bacterium]
MGTGIAYLSLVHTDASGESVPGCPSKGSIVLESTGTGDIKITLNAQLTNGTSITDKQFTVPAVLEPQ